jgi:hypothetical protein
MAEAALEAIATTRQYPIEALKPLAARIAALRGTPYSIVTIDGPDGRTAYVSVEFKSKQITALVDADGKIIEGDANAIVDVVDIWTFARDTRARDPNWALVETRSPE